MPIRLVVLPDGHTSRFAATPDGVAIALIQRDRDGPGTVRDAVVERQHRDASVRTFGQIDTGPKHRSAGQPADEVTHVATETGHDDVIKTDVVAGNREVDRGLLRDSWVGDDNESRVTAFRNRGLVTYHVDLRRPASGRLGDAADSVALLDSSRSDSAARAHSNQRPEFLGMLSPYLPERVIGG